MAIALFYSPEAVVVIDVEADDEVPGSDNTTGAPSVPLVTDTKGGGGRGTPRLAATSGNLACSQETCSGSKRGSVELILATATDRHRLEGGCIVLRQQTTEQQMFTSFSK